jgi:hypothetical protein
MLCTYGFQHGAMPDITAQFNTSQYDTVQCETVQHRSASTGMGRRPAHAQGRKLQHTTAIVHTVWFAKSKEFNCTSQNSFRLLLGLREQCMTLVSGMQGSFHIPAHCQCLRAGLHCSLQPTDFVVQHSAPTISRHCLLAFWLYASVRHRAVLRTSPWWMCSTTAARWLCTSWCRRATSPSWR